MKLNNSNNYEPLCSLRMDSYFKEHFPIAYAQYKEFLIKTEDVTEEEAEYIMANNEIPLELYYEEGKGFFAIETNNVGRTPIYSPYSKERFEEDESVLD